tara:strand:+ start:59 stop:826 length:768 start_codon:yes stop_codon:yes gene_type:complete
MKKIIIFIFILNVIFSQEEQPYPPLKLVSMPTGGTLPKGTFAFETLLMNEGGVLPSFSLGITDHLTFGVSFGIQEFIGVGSFKKNKSYPEVQMKYRIYEETETRPSIVIGLDTQGRGKYLEDSGLERYEQKALGAYLVLSRNYKLLGNLGFHIGVNKNLFENKDGDDDINLFLGLDREINRSFSLLAEYDFAINDNDSNTYELLKGKGRGYLNVGLRWSATDNLMLEININDMSKNKETYDSTNREIKIIYFENF